MVDIISIENARATSKERGRLLPRDLLSILTHALADYDNNRGR